MRHRLLAWSVAMLLIGLLVASFLPLDPYTQDLGDRFAGPSSEHPLGTDQFGRDLLARLLVGARLSLGLTLALLLATTVLGVTLGMLAATLGGPTAVLIDRVTDALMAVPGIIIGLILAAALQPGIAVLALAVLIEGWTPHARISRNLTAQVRHADHVAGAVGLGANRIHILRRHVLPNIAGPLVAHTALRLPNVLLTLAGLSFLGLGAQPPTPEWGAMVADGRRHLSQAPELLLVPAAAIVAVSVAAGVLARAWDRRAGGLPRPRAWARPMSMSKEPSP